MKPGTIIILLFTMLAGATLLYARYIEPFAVEVRRCVIPDPLLAKAWGEIRIVQLSDLHIGKLGRREREVLDKLAKIAPDLIIVTGDLTQWGKRPEKALHFIEKLKAPLGVYGVLGDADLAAGRYRCRFCHPRNDYHEIISAPLLLRDETRKLSLDPAGRSLFLVGLGPSPDPETREHFTRLVRDLPKKTPLLVLSHFSRAWAKLCADSDRPMLWLSGDTHGGQVRLPTWIWKILRIKPDPEHMAGLFHQPGRHHQWLYVNRGLGTTAGFPLRLGVRPEITVFSFRAAKPGSRP